MVRNDVIQADIIADLKALTALTSKLKSATDVKERSYQGTTFGLPAVRLALGRQMPLGKSDNCDHMSLEFSIDVYSELESSREANEILGIVADHYRHHFMAGTGWKGWIERVAVVNAALWAEKLWRAEGMFRVNVYPTSAT